MTTHHHRTSRHHTAGVPHRRSLSTHHHRRSTPSGGSRAHSTHTRHAHHLPSAAQGGAVAEVIAALHSHSGRAHAGAHHRAAGTHRGSAEHGGIARRHANERAVLGITYPTPPAPTFLDTATSGAFDSTDTGRPTPSEIAADPRAAYDLLGYGGANPYTHAWRPATTQVKGGHDAYVDGGSSAGGRRPSTHPVGTGAGPLGSNSRLPAPQAPHPLAPLRARRQGHLHPHTTVGHEGGAGGGATRHSAGHSNAHSWAHRATTHHRHAAGGHRQP